MQLNSSLLKENGFQIQLHKTEAHAEGFLIVIKSKDSIERKIGRIVTIDI